MLEFAFDKALFTFTWNKPVSAPLFQLPPPMQQGRTKRARGQSASLRSPASASNKTTVTKRARSLEQTTSEILPLSVRRFTNRSWYHRVFFFQRFLLISWRLKPAGARRCQSSHPTRHYSQSHGTSPLQPHRPNRRHRGSISHQRHYSKCRKHNCRCPRLMRLMGRTARVRRLRTE